MRRPTQQEQIRDVRRVTLLGLVLNLVLSALKFTGGWLGGSRAAVADAAHSLSDSVSDVAILVGVRFWSAPADDDHPYGHHRIESLVTLSIGLLLALVALGLAWDAIQSLLNPETRDVGWIALVVTGVSVVSKEWLFRWTLKKGREIRSTAVIANAWHHRSDAVSSLPAFVSICVAKIYPAVWYLDAVGAIVVVFFILLAAWRIGGEALGDLTDVSASDVVLHRIRETTLGVEGVLSTHKIRTRRMGGSIMVDLHVQVDPLISVRAGHDISNAVKVTLLESSDDIADVLVHLEPFQRSSS
jgi:cation diffusion facilitator family transporter